MAESRPVEGTEGDKRTLGTENIGSSIPECAVCLQTCVHPAQLPCGHIFCFLCVKGVANQSKKCAMCRQEIPTDYFEKPVLVAQNNTDKDSAGFDGGYQWFYEGRNGWWLYDERTSMDLEEMFKLGESSCEMLICGTLYVIDFKNSQQYRKREPTKKRRIKRDLKTAERWWQYDERTSRELEAAYKKGERICELLVAGLLYIADFDAMLQIRRNDPSRRRRIKRDLATIPKKGVAGLRLEGYQQALGEQGEEARPKSPALQGTTDGAMTPTLVPPTNTPQTPAGGNASGDTTPDQQESLHRAVEQIRSLSFRDDVTALDDSDGGERGSGDEDQELPNFSGVIPSPWVLTFSSDEDLL